MFCKEFVFFTFRIYNFYESVSDFVRAQKHIIKHPQHSQLKITRTLQTPNVRFSVVNRLRERRNNAPRVSTIFFKITYHKTTISFRHLIKNHQHQKCLHERVTTQRVAELFLIITSI